MIVWERKRHNMSFGCYVGMPLFLSWLLFVSKCSELSAKLSGEENKSRISSVFFPLVSGTKQYMNNVPKIWYKYHL